MTYNATLQSLADHLLHPLGGYAGVYPLWTDEQIADACFFNGPTWFTSPYRYRVDDGTTIPYYLFDLTDIGYQPNSKYSVYDADFNFLYSEVATPVTYEGAARYYWGNSDNSRALLAGAAHASRWLLSFNTPDGPVLSQFFVNKSFDRSLITPTQPIPTESNTLNEVFLHFPNNRSLPIRVFSAATSFESISSLVELQSLPGVVSADYDTNQLSTYLQPKSSIWVSAALVDGDSLIPLQFVDIQGLDSWQRRVTTDGEGYQLLFVNAGPTTRSAPMSRVIGGLGTPIATNFLNRDKLLIHAFVGAEPFG